MQEYLKSYVQAAIQGSESYYRYLTEHQRGLIEYRVLKIRKEGSYFVLTLRSLLSYADTVQLRIENKIYTQEQIKPTEYCEQTNELTVRPLDELRQVLADTPIHKITVISDLRFLVKRVEDWYRSYGLQIALPTQLDSVSLPKDVALSSQASEEQKNAVAAALSQPFSYIWGAPGTGKTQFVLAQCILAYVQAQKPIWITAPTNNAVEQMLYGVLPILQEAGISLQKVLRLGVPSRAFKSQYSEVCEQTDKAKLHGEIQAQLLQIEAAIAANQEQLDKLAAYRNFLSFEKAQDFLESALPDWQQRLQQKISELDRLERECIEWQGRGYLVLAELETCQTKEKKHTANVSDFTRQVRLYSSGWRKWLFAGRRDKLMQSLQKEMHELDEVRAQSHQLIAEREEYIQKEADARQQQKQVLKEIAHSKTELQMWASYWKPLLQSAKKLREACFTADLAAFCTQLERARNILEDKRPQYEECSEWSETALLESKKDLEQQKASCLQQKENLEEQGNGIRWRECLVLAGTVDTCLYRMPPNGELAPAHIFLDEAGYCSLIKGAALLAYACPVTFLGDHMQLPPVCEMPDEDMQEGREPNVCLWAQSALFAEDIFTQSILQIANIYLMHRPARFEKLKRFDLTHTYRFGEALAKVLAKTVYSSSFYGNPAHKTDIFVLHAAASQEKVKKRTSPTECRAISSYIQSHPDEQVGVITPYKNQRDAIRNLLPRSSGWEDKVLTVHGSQGREWDTVLFSVVDTLDKWFTDSDRLESNGKRVINTAVSRAKRRLILVCDAEYWGMQHTQLIGQLLRVAERYDGLLQSDISKV